ncbi:MAG: FapA family protein [Spirochaetes bacterium]|nr:FapA family protein [Spirochaetota bacterium]
MITLTEIRDYMKEQLERDKKVKSVQIEGESIANALKQASIELGLPVKKLEYEVIEKGTKGIMGIGKKNWKIVAYETRKPAAVQRETEVLSENPEIDLESIKEENKPGEVFVRLNNDGVFLKVTKPVGKGRSVTERMALSRLSERGVGDYDASLVAKVVKQADGEYIKIGDYQYNPANDSTISLEITDQDMKAYIVVNPPGPGGADLTYDDIISYLNANDVVHGIKEDVIRNFIDYPVYNDTVLIAEGTRPKNGRDARIIYNFRTDHSQIKLKEKDGKVDFKELDLVENVVAGQLLAKKIPPEEGRNGRTVTGMVIPAKAGNDVEFLVGKNVKLSEDGLTAVAEINGQVLLLAGKINVEPVYTIQGDVNLHTGNILFLGTVVVKGNVEDGFSVKAAGNIEVYGSVGKCVLDAEGDIIVHQGILGKIDGKARSGMSVFAKFIEHAHVEAGEYVVASDGIIHSHVDANKKIICQGKRASIVGGRLRATEEINAKNLGSVAGTETNLEVGYDPKSKEKLGSLDNRKAELESKLEELEKNITTIEKLQRIQKRLTEEKKQYLTQLNEKRSEVLSELEEVNRETGSLNTYLESLKLIGKVSASGRVYPGVKVFIKNASLVVRTEFKFVTFYLQSNDVKVTKYEAVEEEDITRRL